MTRAWLFLLLAALLLAAATQLTTVRTDISDFFFADRTTGPESSGFRLGQMQSGELARRYMISVAHADVDDRTVRKFMTTLQRTLSDQAQVQRVWSDPFSHSDIQQLVQFYAPHQRQLLSLHPGQDINRLFSSESMQAQAGHIRDALLGPDPSLAKSLLNEDPMLLTLAWIKRIEQAYKQHDIDPAYSSFFLETTHTGLDTTAQQDFQRSLEILFDELNTQYTQRFTLEYTGVPVFAVSIREQVTRDITRISTLSIGIVILLAWLVFRSLRALACISILLVTTASIAALVTQWVYGYLHGLTLALGTTLIGVCIDYFIHSIVHAGDATGTRRLEAIRRIWPALLVGGTTTLIGYTALSFSGFPGLQQVALFTGSGIVAALLISRYFLPDLMSLFQLHVTPAIDLSWLPGHAVRARYRYLLIVIAVGCLLAGGSRIQWSDDMSVLAPSLQKLAENDQRIRARLSSMEPGRFVLVTGNSMETVLQDVEAVQRQLDSLLQQGSLETYYPLFPWVASAQLQARNRQAWNEALTTATRERWSAALANSGFNTSAFPPLSEASGPALDPAEVLKTAALAPLRTQLQQDDSGTTAVIWLGRHQPEALRDAVQAIPSARYFSQKDNIRQLAGEYRHKAQHMLLLGLLAILVLLGLRYRSITLALRVLSPAILSIMLLLGLWGLSGAPMGMLHLIGLLLTAAVCVDYGVFFLENSGGDRKRIYQAITVSAITTSAAFASLGAAENPALHALAWTVAPGVLTGFLICPVMLGNTNYRNR